MEDINDIWQLLSVNPNREQIIGHYCGLGNNQDAPGYNEIQRACQAHDKGYEKIKAEGRNPYLQYNEADYEFIQSLSAINGAASTLMSGLAKTKKGVFPHDVKGI